MTLSFSDTLHRERNIRRWEPPARRAFDLVVVLFVLVLLAPLLVVVGALVRLESAGPALFRQTRVGRDGRQFTLYKFRSMYVDVDDRLHREHIAGELNGSNGSEPGSRKLQADPRITRVGSLLRKSSIDELPQLWNVVRGDMSLVGPRPCMPWEAEIFPVEFSRRFSVLPGLTGLWQVSGRSRVGTMEMLRLDTVYVDSRGFWRDMLIIFMTIPVLIRGDGAR